MSVSIGLKTSDIISVTLIQGINPKDIFYYFTVDVMFKIHM